VCKRAVAKKRYAKRAEATPASREILRLFIWFFLRIYPRPMNISKVLPRLSLGLSAISIYFFKILNYTVSSSHALKVSMQQMTKNILFYLYVNHFLS